jgi:hypothetical protein
MATLTIAFQCTVAFVNDYFNSNQTPFHSDIIPWGHLLPTSSLLDLLSLISLRSLLPMAQFKNGAPSTGPRRSIGDRGGAANVARRGGGRGRGVLRRGGLGLSTAGAQRASITTWLTGSG